MEQMLTAVDLMSNDPKTLRKQAVKYPYWTLSERQLCDLELLLNGAFFPLKGFLEERDYQSVMNNMRLADGSLWPIPVTLDVSKAFAGGRHLGEKIALRDHEGFAIAVLSITDIYEPDLEEEAELVYGTKDIVHPAVAYLMKQSHKIYLGGELEGISLPHHYDYQDLRHTPRQLRTLFSDRGWERIIAFQTRNPLHKAHVEMTMQSLDNGNSKLLLHPVVGMTKPGDVDHYTRVRCYKHVMKKYPEDTAMMSLLPLAMRMGGPREALWHALIRKNYGCTHLIVGRNHADPGLDSNGHEFYGPYDAQDLLLKYKDEIGIEIVPFKFMVYLPKEKRYEAIDAVPDGVEYQTISGTQLRRMLDEGKGIPEWFTYPEVAHELQLSRPPLDRRGFTVFFTGLSGAGKSTIANGLMVKLLEEGTRPVTLLDGDVVRAELSIELGFSKEHRSLNVRRIGFVASEITKNGGIAICAPIAPYKKDRLNNRKRISKVGGYIEVYVNTPLSVCEERDSKGLYKMAREGLIKEFTGISDPYEIPKNPDIVINSSGITPEVLVDELFHKIKTLGYI